MSTWPATHHDLSGEAKLALHVPSSLSRHTIYCYSWSGGHFALPVQDSAWAAARQAQRVLHPADTKTRTAHRH